MECVSIYGYVLAQLTVDIETMTVRELDKDISTVGSRGVSTSRDRPNLCRYLTYLPIPQTCPNL